MTRTKGSNKHGNKNEQNIVEMLNNKKIQELNPNLKQFIKYICETKNILFNESDILIKAEYEKNSNLKQDFYVVINEKRFGISLKMGLGNSTHQEKIEDFIAYLKTQFNVSDELCDEWRFFIWADGTTDGTGDLSKDSEGNIISRFSGSEFKTKYPEKRKLLQNFLNSKEKVLIERFLFTGRHNSSVDFLYHGTAIDGTWISKEKIIEFSLENSSSLLEGNRKTLSVGRMSIQAWNISRQGNNEKKRGEIQVKYSSMNKDINELKSKECSNIGSFEGDKGEFDLSRTLNKNKKHILWRKILPEIKKNENYYAVKVTKKIKSKLSNRKVSPKTDVYIVKTQIEKDFLLERDYIITEDMLGNLIENYEIVSNSGISVKIKNSKNYTIQKFTVQSFLKAFSSELENANEILFSLLIYSDPKQQGKNYQIAQRLEIDYEEFLNKNSILISNVNSKDLDSIRTNAQKKVISTIENNNKLYEAIFKGKYWFDDPYCASYIYALGDMKQNTLDDFYITTGSGRSKGNYTIEVKPKV